MKIFWWHAEDQLTVAEGLVSRTRPIVGYGDGWATISWRSFQVGLKGTVVLNLFYLQNVPAGLYGLRKTQRCSCIRTHEDAANPLAHVGANWRAAWPRGPCVCSFHIVSLRGLRNPEDGRATMSWTSFQVRLKGIVAYITTNVSWKNRRQSIFWSLEPTIRRHFSWGVRIWS